jgi:hypothetical protein
METFDAILKKQGHFWCPICNLWGEAKRCETVIQYPQMKDGKVVADVFFAICEKCLNSLKGDDAASAARIAIAERSAKGLKEIPDSRLKFYVIPKGRE